MGTLSTISDDDIVHLKSFYPIGRPLHTQVRNNILPTIGRSFYIDHTFLGQAPF
jgi:hypothetical protein